MDDAALAKWLREKHPMAFSHPEYPEVGDVLDALLALLRDCYNAMEHSGGPGWNPSGELEARLRVVLRAERTALQARVEELQAAFDKAGDGPHLHLGCQRREKALEARVRELEALERRIFPVLYSGSGPHNGPLSVPWAWIEKYEGQARHNHSGQTLARMAEGGGLSPVELWMVVHGRDWGTLQEMPVTREQALTWLSSEPWTVLGTRLSRAEQAMGRLREAMEAIHAKVRTAIISTGVHPGWLSGLREYVSAALAEAEGEAARSHDEEAPTKETP